MHTLGRGHRSNDLRLWRLALGWGNIRRIHVTPLLQTTLTLLVLLQVKHMFADFFMQTPRMLSARSVYLHVGRAQHAAIHAAFSSLVFLVIGAPIVFVILLCLFEGVVHFHIDYAKGRYSEKAGHGPDQSGYWRAFGVDQTLHQLTYVAMICVWANYAL
jgi:hypothetical protein